MIVPLPIPAIGPGEGAVSDVHGPLVPPCSRDGDNEDLLPLDGVQGHVFLGEDIGADLAGVVDRLPEELHIPRPIGDAGDAQLFFPALLHAQ